METSMARDVFTILFVTAGAVFFLAQYCHLVAAG
jgi:hypothetical protein